MERINFSSGAALEETAGYSRMVRVGNHVYIGGTTAVTPEGSVSGVTAYEQSRYIFEKFMDLLKRADASIEDVIKVKAYVTDMKDAKDVAAAYSERFKQVRPLFTMVETSHLNRPTQFVEIELEAYIGCQIKTEEKRL